MTDTTQAGASKIKLGLFDMTPRQVVLMRRVPVVVVSVLVGFAAIWVLFLADRSWTTDTSAGSAIAEPGEFLVTFLDGLTFAGLLFVVASGFTLIFGLMRTVNMAHGAFFLFAAYIAISVQQKMVGKSRNIESSDVSMLDWFVPLLVGATVAAVVGVLMQQFFLRWNQGQDLRQAIITIAVTVILADQMLFQYGGLAKTMTWPGDVVHFFEIFGQRYASSRLFMFAISLVVAVALWVWLNRTRMGMVIRAGVDDQEMVRALGINITLVFGITFFVGSFLAGMGGVMGASFSGVALGTDGQWLLNSLIVVIIGGLGSIKGAVAGSLLYGMVTAFSPAYLPSDYTFYSIIFTFVILAVVLAVRPNGLFGRTE
ncbi:branched-chain amino acid ABC transporter permease [Ilumatobacter nonamiensis]|uniref:branched-chain amino acid ABC transporter permease n=1 Tax=Ilumatobacter nonamiensis TaxID=467093 RepID=UPI00034D8B90|nr:branched-chain amino acid ABC transporter permease [Ilumatobacter nonamiensis]